MFATLLAQVEPSWFGPALAAVATVLGIPVVSSAVTGILRRVTDETGLDPRALVWVVAVVVTGIAYAQSLPALPAFDSSAPYEFFAGWLLLGTGFAEVAKVLYDRILKALPVFGGAPAG